MAIAHAEGGEVKHVKAHGALYTMAAKSEALAHAIARAVYDTDARLVLYGLAGSEWIRAGERSAFRQQAKYLPTVHMSLVARSPSKTTRRTHHRRYHRRTASH